MSSRVAPFWSYRMFFRLPDGEANWSEERNGYGDDVALVAARLRLSGYPSLYGLQCDLRDDVFVLSGAVPTYHLKQLAQVLALHTPGVRQVENCLTVAHVLRRGESSA